MTGLEIYKLLPKTNCKKCGLPTCLAFAMALAAKKTSIEKCPDISEESKQSIALAAEPPIRTVVFQDGERSIKLGGETVLFRHDKTFWNPCGLGIYISDALPDAEIDESLKNFSALTFERVGQTVRTEFIYLRNTASDTAKFLNILNRAASTDAFIILNSKKPEPLKSAIALYLQRKFVISGADKSNYEDFLKLATESKTPLAICAADLDEFSQITNAVSGKGFKEIILELSPSSVLKTVSALTQIRRLPLKKNVRSVGFPVMVLTSSDGIFNEVAEASQYIEKYASIVILKTSDIASHMALASLRQNIYTDPQKPVAVESKIYKFGNVGENSPVLVTTNFSLTYYSVAPEIENSRVPCYLLVVDTEGMSVLTAWSADKFTPERISDAMKNADLQNLVKHRKVVIPGYVAVMSGKLNDVSGWNVLVGPKEASGIPKFLKTLV